MARRNEAFASSGFPRDQLLLNYRDWRIVLNALRVYQILLQQEARSLSISIFHWISCGYCRKHEQCPEIEELEITEDYVKEISAILEDLIKRK